ncbi:glycosyltransferase family 2 protein [Paenibacillus pini]|uniref:Glycosyltransferase n=1 Tax=Paenibacillus pini JCM 16418 TaxID=1236976 RepID=W7YJL1_9BACL|nr:glycosyltransferase family 2 protein [Paenibacillus pini]GAF08677.1 glycosyltransferase [Paenibacillus pini JCM 16418]
MRGKLHTAARKHRAHKGSLSRNRNGLIQRNTIAKGSKTSRKIIGSRKRTDRGTVGNQQFQHGYERGYTSGVNQGVESFAEPFHGTSIIIPTYNQADYLIQCITSIEAHTTDPYEIIVVDNGSSDHTGQYLQQRVGQIRFKQLETNRGFAGGVNQGLMMAKGDSIVILNNDTLVTPRWLSNMLRCLYSDSTIGVVGPVTNYISGEQQIQVPYDAVPQMWAFAEQHNVPDESRWSKADRLVGYCLLFRRELLKSTGYFDEGFEIGNYEDEDWMIRVRLSGRELVIAGDTFIHHYGSVSMKNLGQQKFEVVHEQNGTFYEQKWGKST